MTRACPSRFSSSPYGCSLDGGWGPRETRPPAGSWARHPSLSLFLSLSPSLSHSVSPFHRHLSRPSPRLEKRRWRGDSPRGPTRPNPFPAERAAIQHSRVMLLCLVILANDYEVRISVGPPGISGNVPEIGTRDSRRKSIRMDTVDSIGRFEWMIGARRGKWTG